MIGLARTDKVVRFLVMLRGIKKIIPVFMALLFSYAGLNFMIVERFIITCDQT